MTKNKRTLREPRQQVKASIWFFTGLTAALAIFLVLSLHNINDRLADFVQANQLPNEQVSGMFSLITLLIVIVMIASGVAIIAGVMAGYTLERRLFGPIVPIRKLIEELQNGNYKARGHLRKNDEFQDVMNDLNTLAAKLETQKT